jgi:hypothetical protein
LTDQCWTVALAGTGDVTPENAEALLDDWLPVENVSFVFPKLPRNAKTLRSIARWAEAEGIDVVESERGPEVMIGHLEHARAEGDQVYLVLLWDDTEACTGLLEQALAVEIEVKDLTRALDDLEFDDEDENVSAEPAVEPEAAPEPRARRSSKASRGADAAAEGTKRRSESETAPADDGDVAGVSSDTSVPADDNVVVQASAVGPATVAPQGQPITAYPGGVQQVLEVWIRAIVQDELAIKFPPKPESAEIPVLMSDDGEYKLGGKGRPAKGWTATKVTVTEARKLGLLLDDYTGA